MLLLVQVIVLNASQVDVRGVHLVSVLLQMEPVLQTVEQDLQLILYNVSLAKKDATNAILQEDANPGVPHFQQPAKTDVLVVLTALQNV